MDCLHMAQKRDNWWPVVNFAEDVGCEVREDSGLLGC
jgi:hypothetical protein